MAARILIIDDEDDVRELIKATLETESDNYQISEAKDGEAGLAAIEEQKPDLILLDIMMPKLDGYGVCTKVRSDEITRKIPIILLTVKTELSAREDGFRAGADLFLTKPFDPEELRNLVKGVLSGAIPTRKKRSGF